MGIFDELFRPTRVQLRDDQYPGEFGRNYSRQMCSNTTIGVMASGILVVAFSTWFIYYQMTSCGIFCTRLDGPQHTGELHCPDGIPKTLSSDGTLDASFEEHLIAIAADIARDKKIVVTTLWIPDGLIWSYYFKPHTLVLNFLMHLQENAPNLHPLIVCITDYTCQVLRRFHDDLHGGFTVYHDLSNYNCGASKYLERAFNIKYLYAYTLMKNGYDVLLADSDTAFLGDPFPALLEGRTSGFVPDIQALSDSSMDVDSQRDYFLIPREIRLRRPWEHVAGCVVDYPVSEVNYCISTGLMMLYATPDATRFILSLAVEMDTDKGRWEQSAFNIDMEKAVDQNAIVFELMEAKQFNNMNAWINLASLNSSFVERDQWLVAHAGGQHGPTDKIATFKALDLWKIPMILPIKVNK